MQFTLDHDVLLFGDILPRRPPDWKLVKELSQHGTPLTNLAKRKALYGTNTAQRPFDRLKDEMNIFFISMLPNFTKPFALKCDASGVDDGSSMVQEGYYVAFESQKILPHWKESSIYGKVLLVFIHTLTKIKKNWMGNSFQVKIDHPELQYFLEQKQLQERHQKWDSSTLACFFGIDHVKKGSYEVTCALL